MRYLNLLEAQLVAASRELSGAGSAQPQGAWSRLRVLGRRHTRLSALVALLAVTATSGGVAAAAGVFTPDMNLSAPSPLGTASTIPNELASSFAVLRRAAQPADALPAGTTAIAVGGGVSAHYGINVHLSRLAGTVDGIKVWLVAGSTGACMYTSSAGSLCGRDDSVTTQGFVGLQVPVSGGADRFIGVVPDGATVTATNTDGTPGPVSRSGAAFRVSNDPNLRSVTIHEASGRDTTLPVPTGKPPSPPSQSRSQAVRRDARREPRSSKRHRVEQRIGTLV